MSTCLSSLLTCGLGGEGEMWWMILGSLFGGGAFWKTGGGVWALATTRNGAKLIVKTICNRTLEMRLTLVLQNCTCS